MYFILVFESKRFGQLSEEIREFTCHYAFQRRNKLAIDEDGQRSACIAFRSFRILHCSYFIIFCQSFVVIFAHLFINRF